jgi:hypothetical protein
MSNQTIFLFVAIILVTAVVTTALFTVNRVVAQPSNMTKNMTGGAAANMTKNMTGGAAANMTKNMTGGAAAKISNLTKAMGPAAGGGKKPG